MNYYFALYISKVHLDEFRNSQIQTRNEDISRRPLYYSHYPDSNFRKATQLTFVCSNTDASAYSLLSKNIIRTHIRLLSISVSVLSDNCYIVSQSKFSDIRKLILRYQ